MRPSDYELVRELFHELGDLPPEAQAARLEELQVSDEVRKELEFFLGNRTGESTAFQEEQLGALGEAAAELVRRATQEPTSPELPESIAGYAVEGLLGRGGMGVVYRGQQENPRREVAIKVLHGFARATERRRFEYEAEILARLDHPYVANVIEAGVDEQLDQLPYIVMELVVGCDLITYAEQERLPLVRKLELFIRVCEGVQHAHQHGIVHRDIKPANILVSREGRPRLLDFGIARPTRLDGMDDASTPGRTASGSMLGSLAWMSPEQAQGKVHEIDVRSDVYSLGAVLYRLISGRMPYEIGQLTPWEAAQRIVEQEPARLEASLRGDLEAIVTMALDKDPQRRYGSAGALSRDLQRFLDLQPVEARPWSGTYQIAKFARRHRILVGMVAALMLSLAGGLAVSLSLLRQAEAARKVADDETEKAKQAALLAQDEQERAEEAARLAREEAKTSGEVVSFLQDIFSDASSYRKDPQATTAREVLDNAASRIDFEFRNAPEVRSRLLGTMGLAYGSLGLVKRADELTEFALGAASEELQGSKAYFDALQSRASLLTRQTRYEEALPLYDQCITGFTELLGPDSWVTLRARATRVQARVWSANQEPQFLQEVEDELLELIGRYEALGQSYDRDLQLVRTTLSGFYTKQGRLEEAGELARLTLDAFTESRGGGSPSALRMRSVLTGIERQLGRPEEALRLAEEGYELASERLPEEHPARFTLHLELGPTYLRLGRFEEADLHLTEGVRLARQVWSEDHLETQRGLYHLGLLRSQQGQLAEAKNILAGVLQRERESLGRNHPSPLDTQARLGTLQLESGQVELGLGTLRDAYQRALRNFGPVHLETLAKVEPLGKALVAAEAWEELETLTYEAVEACREKLGAEHPLTVSIQVQGALLALEEGESLGLLEHLKQTMELADRVIPSKEARLGVLEVLVQGYLEIGEVELARPLAQELLDGTPQDHPSREQREDWLQRAIP